MSNDNYNGAKVSIGGSDQAPLLSTDYTEDAAEIETTGSNDTAATSEVGLPDGTLTMKVLGVSAKTVGDVGNSVITWNDGTNDTIGNGVVVSLSVSGEMDGEISSELEIAPAP